jgi:hypothetical protein
MADAKTERDELRAAALASEPDEFELVEHNGKKIEVRPPSMAQQRYFARASKEKKPGEKGDVEQDGFKFLILAMIGCSYVPGTETKVFESADMEALLAKRMGRNGLVTKLTRVVHKLMNPVAEEVDKDFEADPTDSSSSA